MKRVYFSKGKRRYFSIVKEVVDVRVCFQSP
jgi:hypothetical protein